jgi:hypothetical protein
VDHGERSTQVMRHLGQRGFEVFCSFVHLPTVTPTREHIQPRAWQRQLRLKLNRQARDVMTRRGFAPDAPAASRGTC